MTYAQVRQQAANGDVLLVQGTGFVARVVRLFTSESYNHVALLVWLDDGLWVAEFTSPEFRMTPASQWRYDGHIEWGEAPLAVRESPTCVRSKVLSWRARGRVSYSYLTLLRVWWAQVVGSGGQPSRQVCSTFVADVWKACGYRFGKTPDPGDVARACATKHRVEG